MFVSAKHFKMYGHKLESTDAHIIITCTYGKQEYLFINVLHVLQLLVNYNIQM